MKKIILASTFVLAMAITLSAWADEAHHPDSSGQPATEMTQEKTDSSIVKMEESRQKMEATQSPTERKAMMQQHMQHMKDGMKMMTMMGGKSMMSDMDTSKMPMAERMTLMEKKMKMMGKMKCQGGMMGGKGMMMGGMMGMGSKDGKRIKIMEGQMQMMMEMMRGMMSQQEMMMKK